MVRGLLLTFTLLTAVLPSGVCVCELLHLRHDLSDAGAPHEPDDCPCGCELHPREATSPDAPAVEGEPAQWVLVAFRPSPTAPPAAAARGESPPGPDPSRPLYLSVGRLLI